MSHIDVSGMTTMARLAWTEPGMEDWVTSAVKTQKARSVETYLRMLGSIRAQANDAGLNKPFLEMTKEDMRSLVAIIRTMGSANQYCGRLRSFLKFHERDDLRKILPVLKANTKKVGPDDIFSVSELNAMLTAAVSKRDRVLISVLYESGGRIHEVLNLNLENLERHENGGNDARPWFRAWLGKMKEEGTEHYAYFTGTATVAILDEWIKSYPTEITTRPRPLIPSFAVSGIGRLTEGGANDLLQSVAKRAGIAKRVHAHLFRHTRATHLLREGKPEAVVRKMLGWVPGSKMIGRYSHLSTADVDEALGLTTGSKETKVELVVPNREVPAMSEIPFQRNAATVLSKVAELESKLEALKATNPEVKTMVDLRERTDLAVELERARTNAMSPGEIAARAEADALAERLEQMERQQDEMKAMLEALSKQPKAHARKGRKAVA